MRDGCTLTSLGTPVVVVVQEVFERAARIHAKGSGCADLAIRAYAHPPPGAAVDARTWLGLARELAAHVVAALRDEGPMLTTAAASR